MTQIVLGVLVLVAIIIAFDAVRSRRLLRARSIDLDGLITARATATASGEAVAVDTIVDRALAEPASGPDVGALMDTLVDPSTFRPKLAEGTEWRLFTLRWGNDYGIAVNPARDVHFRLEPWEIETLDLLDGTRTTGDIIVDRLEDDGDLDPGAVVGLVRSLHESGFLDPRPIDSASVVQDGLDPSTAARKKLRTFGKSLRIDWAGANDLAERLYRGGFRFAFTPVAAVIGIAIAVSGIAAFLSVEHSGRFSLNAASAPAESAVLILLSLILTFAHELGHALVETKNGRHIGSAGFFIFFGSPAFFVDSSDGLMMDRWQRILQSAMGPGFELVLSGIASLVVFAFPDWGPSTVLYRFALLNLFVVFLNLIPLLELDGYWIFSDLIQVPDLRPRSLAFVQHDLWHKLRVRERFSRQEVGLGLYGIVGVAFTAFSFFTAFFFWKEIFGGLVTGLWDGGFASRVLLLLLALFLAGPLIRGTITLARTLVRRVVALVQKVRFRVETSWRVEAAELIDALPAFEDLPAEILSDLAGRVTLRTVRQGQPVFRQGSRAEAFYVVRTGVVHIEAEHPDTGDTQVLTVLRRGDSFGEIGLLKATPRAATARAVTETELFEVGKGTFDRLLADSIDAPEFGLTLQAMAELRDLPVFAALSSEALGEMLEHGSWVTAAPGEALIEQGEEGDAFYAVRSGRVDVIRDGELVATMGPGRYFGEMALLTDEPRNATVAAHTPVRAFRLTRAGFDAVIAEAFRGGTLKPATDRTWEH